MLKTETIVLAANQDRPVYMSGKVVGVVSCTVASFGLAFDNDPLILARPATVYPSDKPFDKIRVSDLLGGGCTIELVTSDSIGIDISAQASSAALAAMIALLTTIDADTGNLAAMLTALQHLTPPANEDTIVPAAIAITGGVADTIMAARPTRKDLWFETPLTNAGDVYMGFDNAVSDANYARRMPPGAVWWPRWTGAVYATSENGTEVLHGYETW